jgi:3-methylcrotonyl-CoA carboxylase alpha subunit
MIETLRETVIFGVKTNIPFLLDILHNSEFIDSAHSTAFIKKHFPNGANPYTMNGADKKYLELAKKQARGTTHMSDEAASAKSPWGEPWRFM